MQSTVTHAAIGSDHSVSENLGLWEPKRTLTLEAASKHSKRIKVLRKLLVALSIIIMAGVVWQFINQPRGFDLVDNPDETVRMVNPKYSGRTTDGLPYYLTASEAVRNAASSTAVNLSVPVLKFYRVLGSEPSQVTALSGTYDDVDNILNLRDTVKLGTDDGYACETSHAKMFTKEKRLSGDEAIACTGSFGAVNGNSFTITQDYKVFTFADGMSATITRETAKNTRGETLGFDGNDPINISAKTASYKSAVTTLSGTVDVKQGRSHVSANNMLIYRAKATDEQGSLKLGAVTKIDAKGKFVYIAPNRHLSGNRGVYERGKNIITVTGSVVLKQGSGNTIKGDKLVYDLTQKKARVGEACSGENCRRVSFELKPQGK